MNKDSLTGYSTSLVDPRSNISSVYLRNVLKKRRSTALIFTLVSVMIPISGHSERLPVRVYSTADGLPSNQTTCVKRDSRGFLWFCTVEGLSRFDGYTFTNYGVDQGLPDRVVTNLLETRNGEYWVATYRGLARFDPRPSAKAAMFTVYRPHELGPAQEANALVEDRQGTIWVGTNGGVFQLVRTGGQWVLQHPSPNPAPDGAAENLLEDHDGSLWISTYNGSDATLCRRSLSGRLDIFKSDFLRGNRILTMLEDRQERIWVGTYHGLALLVANPQAGGPLIEHLYGKREGLREVQSLFQSSDGRLWVGADGLFQMESSVNGNEVRFNLYAREILGIDAEDREGNFWVGRTRIARNGFVSYGRADGLADEGIRAIFESRSGDLFVISGYHNRFFQRFEEGHFIATAPKAPGHSDAWDWEGWGWGQIHLQDHTGEWWVATGHGLIRYPKVEDGGPGTYVAEGCLHDQERSWREKRFSALRRFRGQPLDRGLGGQRPDSLGTLHRALSRFFHRRGWKLGRADCLW